MRRLWIASVAAAWTVALLWAARAVATAMELPRAPDLRDPQWAHGDVDLPSVAALTVIVPARNEAAAIEDTLRSLLAQTIPLEIVAVDDRSTDATGAILDRVAQEAWPPGKRLRVLHVEALPENWLGKPHAMGLAARQATTQWLLFTDADVIFHPDVLRRALRCATEQEADHRYASDRMNGLGPAWFFTMPTAAVLVLYAMLRSGIVTTARGGVVWRGTFYPLRELRRHAGPIR